MDYSRLANAIFLSLLVLSASVPMGWTQPVHAEQGVMASVVQSQAVVTQRAFGSAYSDVLIALKLDSEPVELGLVTGSGPADESITWTTAFIGSEVFSQVDDMSVEEAQQVANLRAQAHITVGTLSGPSGSSHAIGVVVSAVEGGVRSHALIPIAEVSAEFAALIAEATELVQMPLVQATRNPCASITHCHDIYRPRVQKALNEYTACMADQVVPFSWKHLLCLAACLPLMLGTPLLYAACVAGCWAVVVVADAGLAIIAVCNANLEFALENAKSAYCNCIAWKEANCQFGDWETDIVGCGP
jgi:hypothetical protein